jgi:hypothetical protein
MSAITPASQGVTRTRYWAQAPGGARIELDAVATWTHDSNWTAWTAVLGSTCGTAWVPPVAAPARLEEAAGLAPAYIGGGRPGHLP